MGMTLLYIYSIYLVIYSELLRTDECNRLVSYFCNKDNRALIHMSRTEVIPHGGQAHEPDKENTRPVEVCSIHMVAIRPEAPEKRPARINKCSKVDR